jgi:hypothetical protein
MFEKDGKTVILVGTRSSAEAKIKFKDFQTKFYFVELFMITWASGSDVC